MKFSELFKRQRHEVKPHFDDLDLPPAPPPVDKFESEPEHPGFSPGKIVPPPEEDIPKAPEPLDLPELPPIPSFKEEKKPSFTMEPQAKIRSSFPAIPAEKEVPAGLAPHVIRHTRPRSLYIKLSDLKNILVDSREIKNDLKESQDILETFENIGERQENAYNKMDSLSHNIQRKLVYLEKKLFKGDKT